MKEQLSSSNDVLLLNRRKKGILKIIFSRTTFIMIMLLLQIIGLSYAFLSLSEYFAYIFGGSFIISVIMVIHITNKPLNPTVKMVWIAIIALLPPFGIAFYLYLETDLGFKVVKRMLAEIIAKTKRFVTEDKALAQQLKKENKHLYNLSQYTLNHGGYPAYKNTSVKYFPIGENQFDFMIEELKKAEKFIFIETFIIKEGYMWGMILKILSDKAAQGVDVRVLYDGSNSVLNLPYGYPHELQKLGIKCHMFSPPRPLMSSTYNNRDHRKIMVIDGHTAFTGGINLADEYINLTSPHGHWKDAGIMLKGEAVKSFTLMFLQMWSIEDSAPDFSSLLNTDISIPHDAAGCVIPYGDSPLDDDHVGELIYMDILNTAKDYVYIMTPYLILDNEMVTALQFAAKRGVDVRLVLPHIPDKKTIFAMTRNHYKELVSAGVKIYEYTPGFVHSKVFLSDDIKGVVGTINLDYRSLYLHFECGTYLYDVPALKDIRSDFEDTIAKSEQITAASIRKLGIISTLIGRVLKIFAPLT